MDWWCSLRSTFPFCHFRFVCFNSFRVCFWRDQSNCRNLDTWIFYSVWKKTARFHMFVLSFVRSFVRSVIHSLIHIWLEWDPQYFKTCYILFFLIFISNSCESLDFSPLWDCIIYLVKLFQGVCPACHQIVKRCPVTCAGCKRWPFSPSIRGIINFFLFICFNLYWRPSSLHLSHVLLFWPMQSLQSGRGSLCLSNRLPNLWGSRLWQQWKNLSESLFLQAGRLSNTHKHHCPTYWLMLWIHHATRSLRSSLRHVWRSM